MARCCSQQAQWDSSTGGDKATAVAAVVAGGEAEDIGVRGMPISVIDVNNCRGWSLGEVAAVR